MKVLVTGGGGFLGSRIVSNAIDSARLSLTIGQHSLLVDGGRAGVFEATFSIDDGETTALDVTVRPAIAWLGVFGGDLLDRDAARSLILPELAAVGGWALLDRSTAGEAVPGGASARLPAPAQGSPLLRRAWQRT